MGSSVRRWFDSIDVDGSGQVDCRELQRALASGNLHFSLSTVSHMIRLHKVTDVENEGRAKLGYDEFKLLHEFLDTTQTSFCDARPVNGKLTHNQLAGVLKHAGFNLPQKVFAHLLDAFDPERKNEIDLTAFIRLTLFLRSAHSAFGAFDPRQTGRITMDFNQFLYAATNLI